MSEDQKDNEVNRAERALLIGHVQKNEALLRSIGVVTDEPEVSEGFDGGASDRESGPFPTDPERDHADAITELLMRAKENGASDWDGEDD